MKICLVSPYDYLHPGGVSEHMHYLAEGLRKRDHEVMVLAPSSAVDDKHGIPGYIRIGRSVPVRSNGSVARIALSFHLVKRVRKLLDTERFDVVHYQEPLVPALPITVLRLHHGANVGTFHAMAKRNLGYYYGRPFLKPYFNRLHACIAVSKAAEEFINQYFSGKYHIVPNGIDTSRFRLGLSPMPNARTPGKYTLLFVGRLEQRKGLSVLLRSYEQLRQRRSDVRLVVVGEGPMRWEYENYVASTGLPDVAFVGRVTPEELPHYYASADIFCAPATGKESFGIVLLEAMASGVPVIASDISGFQQVVAAREDGLLTLPREVAGWTEAIDGLLENEARRLRMGEAGVKKASSYDWQKVVDSVLAVYDEARGIARNQLLGTNVYQRDTRVG